MRGANEYATLFSTSQHGRLYLVSSFHGRGKTFRIYVLPAGEDAIPNGSRNAPLNKNAVEVFGITGGHAGWDEQYGWIHRGPWEQDFAALVEKRKQELAEKEQRKNLDAMVAKKAEEARIQLLLADYKPSEVK